MAVMVAAVLMSGGHVMRAQVALMSARSAATTGVAAVVAEEVPSNEVETWMEHVVRSQGSDRMVFLLGAHASARIYLTPGMLGMVSSHICW